MESLEVKFTDDICDESDWYFCNITESGWF